MPTAANVTEQCRSCSADLVGPRLELGDLPPCNRFEATPVAIETHALTMTACPDCGFIQLIAPMPVSTVRPRLPWIRYNEPEGHLDHLASITLAELGHAPRRVFGAGPFEAPLHKRFADNGATSEIAAPPSPPSYLETWQQRIETGAVTATEPADIVSCRYILEHCHDPKQALAHLGAQLADDGLLLVEVPDSAKFLRAGDYAFPWEEHISYFTEQTFVALCQAAGFEIARFLRYPGQLEDALVVLLRRRGGQSNDSPAPADGFASYQREFGATRAAVRDRLAKLAGVNRDKIALFGVGHQAIMFANAFGVAEYIASLVDDDANKRGAIAPGFSRPIISSAELIADEAIETCLLAVAPRAEAKVRALLKPLADRGVAFYFIFAGVEGSILGGDRNG